METLGLWGEFSFVVMFKMSSYSFLEFSGFILNVTYFCCLFVSNTSRIALVPVMDFGCVPLESFDFFISGGH